MAVVMKALYGVEYVVDRGLSAEEAVKLREYILSTCDEKYFDNLMVTDVIIREGV